MGTLSIPILQVRKPRHRMLKKLASKWQSWNMNPDALAPAAVPITPISCCILEQSHNQTCGIKKQEVISNLQRPISREVR